MLTRVADTGSQMGDTGPQVGPSLARIVLLSWWEVAVRMDSGTHRPVDWGFPSASPLWSDGKRRNGARRV